MEIEGEIEMDVRSLIFTVLIFCGVIFAGGSLYVALAGNYGVAVPEKMSAIQGYTNSSIETIHGFAKEQQTLTSTQSKNILEQAWNQGNALVNLMTGTVTAIFITVPNTILSVLGVGTSLFGIPTIYVDLIMSIVLIFILFEIIYMFFGRPPTSSGG